MHFPALGRSVPTGTHRKRCNRALNRRILAGHINEDEAKFWHGPVFRQPQSHNSRILSRPQLNRQILAAHSGSNTRKLYSAPWHGPQKRIPDESRRPSAPTVVTHVSHWQPDQGAGSPLGQYKGEGKGGSLGVAVAADSSDAQGMDATSMVGIPPPLPANTQATVQEMFDTGYYHIPNKPFWNGDDVWEIKPGTHLLWKNVPTGKNGGPSTKDEVFHGICHGWASHAEIWVS